MPEQPDPTLTPPAVALVERLQATPGLASLVAEAETTWRAFEDAFPTFYEFTNRPR